MRHLVTNQGILEEYYTWLTCLVNPRQQKNYTCLLRQLHQTPFSWTIPNDDNRAFEARALREWFCVEENIKGNHNDFPNDVSMLEVMIGLAERFCDGIADHPQSKNLSQCFWLMIKNLKLIKYTDEKYTTVAMQNIRKTIENVIKRDYKSNGEGGLFPLKFCESDQRQVELWYQMSAYIVENYYL